MDLYASRYPGFARPLRFRRSTAVRFGLHGLPVILLLVGITRVRSVGAAQFSVPSFSPSMTLIPSDPDLLPRDAGAPKTPQDPDRAALFHLAHSDATTNAAPPALPFSGGIASLDSGMNATPENVDVRVEMIRVKDVIREAQALLADSREDDAVSLLEDSVESLVNDASKVGVYNELSIILYKQKQYAEASKFMRLGLELDNKNVQIASNLSAIYLYLGEIDKALETLGTIPVKLIQDRQVLFTTHFNFACAYSMNQQREEALTHLQVAAKIDPWQTFTSMGDVQLDNLRDHESFKRLREALDKLLKTAG